MYDKLADTRQQNQHFIEVKLHTIIPLIKIVVLIMAGS
jgi:hypothetical protein